MKYVIAPLLCLMLCLAGPATARENAAPVTLLPLETARGHTPAAHLLPLRPAAVSPFIPLKPQARGAVAARPEIAESKSAAAGNMTPEQAKEILAMFTVSD